MLGGRGSQIYLYGRDSQQHYIYIYICPLHPTPPLVPTSPHPTPSQWHPTPPSPHHHKLCLNNAIHESGNTSMYLNLGVLCKWWSLRAQQCIWFVFCLLWSGEWPDRNTHQVSYRSHNLKLRHLLYMMRIIPFRVSIFQLWSLIGLAPMACPYPCSAMYIPLDY